MPGRPDTSTDAGTDDTRADHLANADTSTDAGTDDTTADSVTDTSAIAGPDHHARADDPRAVDRPLLHRPKGAR